MKATARFFFVPPALAGFLWAGLADGPWTGEAGPTLATAVPIAINDNRTPAGSLRNGLLTIHLEARSGEWHPDRDSDPGLVVRAFGEEGKPPQIPGPLIRVPRGTVVHASIRNTLTEGTLVIHGLSEPGAAGAGATISIEPGATGEVRFVAAVVGTYYYWGTTTGAETVERPGMDSHLSGALVVDAGERPANDRIFVLGLWRKVPRPGGIIDREDLLRFTINGRAWPNTERLTYSVGDSVRFRIINTTVAPHPMHLHGFYFNVDSRGNGQTDRVFDPAGTRRMVVTERAGAGNTFTLTWIPDRAGNWLFHCHDNYHVLRNRALDGTPPPAEHLAHVDNHALEMMGGLVMGVEVRPRPGERRVAEPTVRRSLRLVVRTDTGGTDGEPAYGYQLHDGARVTPAAGPLLPGPTIVLRRGEPVSIMVVNELREATAVHWHGIELDSYYDGVSGFSGHPGRISPVIAPGDSFAARFTPPRAGTFMYHPHADEIRQQEAGLSGAIVVVESGAAFEPATDIVLLLSTPRRAADRSSVYLNGSTTPPALDWRVGERYRLRLINIHTARPSMIARLERDSTLLTWKAIAKDGMDLPADQISVQPARQQVGNGEAFDFEFTPEAPGPLRFTVTSGVGVPLVTVAIRVR